MKYVKISCYEYRQLLEADRELTQLKNSGVDGSAEWGMAFDEDMGWDEDEVEAEIEAQIKSRLIKE